MLKRNAPQNASSSIHVECLDVMVRSSGHRSALRSTATRFEVLNRRGIGKLREQQREKRTRFDANGIGGVDERIRVRARSRALNGIAEHPPFPTDHARTDDVLTAPIIKVAAV